MKRILVMAAVLLLAVGNTTSAQVSKYVPPVPTTYVTDSAGVLKNHAEVNSRLQFIRDSLQLSLVAVTLPTIGDHSPADVAREIGRTWKVATANDTIGSVIRNTGGVILLVIDSRDCRVEVAAGSEGYLTDARAGRLCRTAADYFRRGDFDGGILYIANEFAVYHQRELTSASGDSTLVTTTISSGAIYTFLFIIGLALFFWLVWWAFVGRPRKKQRLLEEHAAALRRAAEIRERDRLYKIEQKKREDWEAKRWAALTPEQQRAELDEKARLAEQYRIESEARRKREAEEYEARQRRSSYSTSYSSGGSSGFGGGSSWSGGGSSGFMGGGGGSKW